KTPDFYHITLCKLSDKTSSLPGVVWDNARELRGQFTKGDVVKIRGFLGTYREKPQVRIDKIRLAREGEYEPDSFIPSTPKDIEALSERVQSLVDSIRDPHLLQLGKLIFDNPQLLREFTKSPAGMKWHHPYIGGLLEHSVGVTEICEFLAQHHPELNRDLLVLAALIHDIGKIREYSATRIIEFTDEGRLEGHIVIGERFVRNMCDRINGFPARLRMLLSHLMLSHQGHKEFNSPVEPMTPEGFALYYADELDSKLNAIGRIVDKTRADGKTWSDFNRIISRFILAEQGEEPEDSLED
ncbi:3'-5' exoribonuclease YhaM family protein, partial [Candidatus Latescibacterota bacterium]